MCWIAAHAQHILSSQRPANEVGRHIVKSSSLRIFSYFSWTVPCYICRRCGERGWKWESVEISLTVGSIQLRARGGRVTWCAGRGGELATSSATSDTGSRLWQLSRGHSSSWCSGWVSQYNVAKPRVCWELFWLQSDWTNCFIYSFKLWLTAINWRLFKLSNIKFCMNVLKFRYRWTYLLHIDCTVHFLIRRRQLH